MKIFSLFRFLLIAGLAVFTISAMPSELKEKEKVRIAIISFDPQTAATELGLGNKARDILKNDLKRFERFVLIERRVFVKFEKAEIINDHLNYKKWDAVGAQWVVKTQYETGANGAIKFTFRVYDVINEHLLIGKQYHGRKKILRTIIRRMADNLMKKLNREQEDITESQVARKRPLEREPGKKGMPGKIDKDAYVRAHFGKGDALSAIGAAGEFILDNILKADIGLPIEPSISHPLKVEFVESKGGKFEKTQGMVGAFSITSNASIHADVKGEIADPITEGLRSNFPGIGIPLFNPRLRNLSGGFKVNGHFVVGKHKVAFRKGGVMTAGIARSGFFIKGTEAVVDNLVFKFNGKDWHESNAAGAK